MGNLETELCLKITRTVERNLWVWDCLFYDFFFIVLQHYGAPYLGNIKQVIAIQNADWFLNFGTSKSKHISNIFQIFVLFSWGLLYSEPWESETLGILLKLCPLPPSLRVFKWSNMCQNWKIFFIFHFYFYRMDWESFWDNVSILYSVNKQKYFSFF